jgi:hypothetical protein
MKYVVAEFDEKIHGFSKDPRPYLAVLPQLLPDLPPGAAAFAGQEGRFDRYNRRTVTNLLFGTMRLADDYTLGLEAHYEPHFATHDTGLTIRYTNVASVEITVEEEDYELEKRLGHLMLDEILPDERGCRHEIAFHFGSITIVSADLHARWDDPTG